MPADEIRPCFQLFLSVFSCRSLESILSDKDLSGEPREVFLTAKDPILAQAVAEAKKHGVQPRCVTRSGRPAEEICRLAEEMDVDLLVLGSPDRRPSIAKSFVDLDRLLGASLSDYVRVHANCPVLLARSVA